MKSSSKRELGIVLVVVSSLAFAVACCQVAPLLGFVDFPCIGREIAQEDITSDTRMAYCISIWPRQAISGGGIYDSGTSNQDEVQIDPLILRRDDLMLSINDHEIHPGQTYTIIRFFAFNPWVVLTNRFEVRNDGLMAEELASSASVLFVSGDVYEGWFPNPLGLIVLICGIWLIRQGKGDIEHQVIEANAG